MRIFQPFVNALKKLPLFFFEIIPVLFSSAEMTLFYVQGPPGPPGPESAGACSCPKGEKVSASTL